MEQTVFEKLFCSPKITELFQYGHRNLLGTLFFVIYYGYYLREESMVEIDFMKYF